MKKDVNLKMLLFAVGLLFSFSFANAQSGNNDVLSAKQEYQKRGAPDSEQLQKQQTDVHSDEYRAAKEAYLKNGGPILKEETKEGLVRPNTVLSTSIKDGLMEYKIQLGWDVKADKEAAIYQEKLAASRGVLKVNVDYKTNTVVILVKEEDEWNTLPSLFEIEK